ncbi:DUF6531 domain-containing protein [Marinicrinis lubricantis]|uniref:DUF6531 domain-containing protein n=1 Tax=Marinicrinis lubricantis TaxID=2086470 RepID=A0ABW1IJS9_9BACL
MSKKPRRSWKKRIRRAWILSLAAIIFITGLPMIPGLDIEEAYADTAISIEPHRFSSIYGGLADVSFQYLDYGEYEAHDTAITLHQNGTMLETLDSAPYATGSEQTYTWDGTIQGQPALDGQYNIKVTPVQFAAHGGDVDVEVFNPNPPAPAYIEMLPNPESDTHVIRGIAEKNTQVFLYVKYTRRVGDDRQVVDPGDPVVWQEAIPVSDTRTWSQDIPDTELQNYFDEFPAYGRFEPQDYIGEWEVEVELPPYLIADITAVAYRPYDQKWSEDPSEILRVLRYKAQTDDTKWAYLANYYYNKIYEQEIADQLHDVAEDNGLPVETCFEGQTCYNQIPEGYSLLLFDPINAGNILEADREKIEEEFANKNGHPLAKHFDPINMATGDFSFYHTNMTVQAVMPLEFAISYHSRESYNGDLGYGWHHTFERRLEFRDGDVVYVVTPEGASLKYTPTGNGQYETPAGVYDTLVKNSDGSYTLTAPQQWEYVFRQDGMLYGITDNNGHQTKLTYYGTVLKEVSTEGAKLLFTYGNGGKIMEVTDHTGRKVQYRYDEVNHHLEEVVLPDGAVIGFDYDERHRMTAIHNPNQTASLINEYDDQDRVVAQRAFSGEWGYMEYFPDQMQTRITNERGYVQVYEYDERQRKTAVHYPDGSSEHFEYDGNDNLTRYIDPKGNENRFIYDGKGNMLQAIDALGNMTTYTYNGWNMPETITDALGNVTRMAYDSKGNLTSITDALGRTTTIVRNEEGIPVRMVSPSGAEVAMDLDAYGFVENMTNPKGDQQQLLRDDLHRVTQITDALGQTSKVEYDPRGRVTAQIDALLHRESFQYDDNSNMTAYTDKSGATTTYGYDAFDRLTSVTDALGRTTRFTYDEIGNISKQEDPNGAVTLYEYDEVDRLVKVIDPQGYITEYDYDLNGNLVQQKDPNGGITTVTYDARNLPITISDPEGGTTTYQYDALGRLTQETNALGHSITYAYDAAGQVTSVTDALGYTTQYKYDLDGQLIETIDPNGAVWKMEYDANGQLERTIDPYGHETKLVRDALGRVTQAVDEAGNRTTYTYDALGQVIAITDALGQRTEYTYDERGLLTAIKDAKQQTTSYAYDAVGQLLSVTNALNEMTSYRYDAMGNIVSKTDALQRMTRYEYDVKSQLVKEINPLQEMTQLFYDGNGNVTRIVYPGNHQGQQDSVSYTYDLNSRLTGIQYSDGQQVQYAYDLLGRRTRMVDEVGVTQYQYDALNRVTSVTDAFNQTIQYEWTPTGAGAEAYRPIRQNIGASDVYV